MRDYPTVWLFILVFMGICVFFFFPHFETVSFVEQICEFLFSKYLELEWNCSINLDSREKIIFDTCLNSKTDFVQVYCGRFRDNCNGE